MHQLFSGDCACSASYASSHPMGCMHLVTCRACARKSGYTSYNSVYVYTMCPYPHVGSLARDTSQHDYIILTWHVSTSSLLARQSRAWYTFQHLLTRMALTCSLSLNIFLARISVIARIRLNIPLLACQWLASMRLNILPTRHVSSSAYRLTRIFQPLVRDTS